MASLIAVLKANRGSLLLSLALWQEEDAHLSTEQSQAKTMVATNDSGQDNDDVAVFYKESS